MPSKINTYERQKTLSSHDVGIHDQETPAADAAKPGGHELDVEPVYRAEQLDTEKFMCDEMEIVLLEAATENDPQFCEVNVSGDYRLLMRNGEPQRVKRYHVEALARAKQSRVKQEKVTAPEGSQGYRETNVLSLTYPFQVMNDPNPKVGGPWLRKLLSNPV
jgi:hypothetical protein